MSRVADDDSVVGPMRIFLAAGLSGCGFAKRLAAEADEGSEPGIRWVTVRDATDPDLPENLSVAFDLAATFNKAPIAVFPTVRSPASLVELLAVLSKAAPRWRLSQATWKAQPGQGCLVWARWKTANGQWSSVMGMAPFGCMPVHRRSPHVALALWSGGKSNPYRQTKNAADVGLIDMPLPSQLADKQKFDKLWKDTRQRTANWRMCVDKTKEGSAEPDVTFCLPSRYQRRALAFCEGPPGPQIELF
jgi:hypothetical protein